MRRILSIRVKRMNEWTIEEKHRMYIKKGVNGDKLSTVKHGIGCEGDKKKEKGKKESSSQQCIKLFTGGRRGEGGGKKRGGELAETKLRPLLPFFTGIGLPAWKLRARYTRTVANRFYEYFPLPSKPQSPPLYPFRAEQYTWNYVITIIRVYNSFALIDESGN